MNIGTFIICRTTGGIYIEIAKGLEKRCDNSNYELERPKKKKVIALIKGESGGKLMVEFAALWSKTYSYLVDDIDENKTKSAKKCVVKRKPKFEENKNRLDATQVECKINQLEENKVDVDILRENHKAFIENDKSILKSQPKFRNEKHAVFTEHLLYHWVLAMISKCNQ